MLHRTYVRRTVRVQPGLQIVRPTLNCVTTGFVAPGVQRVSGNTKGP